MAGSALNLSEALLGVNFGSNLPSVTVELIRTSNGCLGDLGGTLFSVWRFIGLKGTLTAYVVFHRSKSYRLDETRRMLQPM